MAPEVFNTVCYDTKDSAPDIAERHVFHPAILHGYCRRRVKGADYPGIVADADHIVRGSLVTGLTPANLRLLDYFEGNEYERREVPVRLLLEVGEDKGAGNVEGEECVAYVYVYLKAEQLEAKEWDFQEFRREKMQKWTRAGYVFEGKNPVNSYERELWVLTCPDCDPDQPATVAKQSAIEQVKESAV
jgi:gamma-glutamylcyclotransferase (GGCT)/AIG2-like uncharacterized protein YtfP